MPQSLGHRLKNLVRKGLLSEQDLERIVIIPIDATNGDVIKATIPYIRIVEDDNWVFVVVPRKPYGIFDLSFPLDWWNAKFER